VQNFSSVINAREVNRAQTLDFNGQFLCPLKRKGSWAYTM